MNPKDNKALARMLNPTLSTIDLILERLSLSLFGIDFKIIAEEDKLYGSYLERRVYLQVVYIAPCTKTGEVKEWKGRKWYLSSYMTQDEVIKTAYAAFKTTVEHEVMEGFKVDTIILFNPHTSVEELLKISHKEVTR